MLLLLTEGGIDPYAKFLWGLHILQVNVLNSGCESVANTLNRNGTTR
jgi:hypothetical protein